MSQNEIDLYKKFNVPPCPCHPDVQMKYLGGFNTGMAVFWKKDVHGQPILAAVHPDSPIPVMKDEEWHQNNFLKDQNGVGTNQTVMDRLWELMLEIPINATRNLDVQNSVAFGSIKCIDCYLVNLNFSKNCFYGYALLEGEDSVDTANSVGVRRSFAVAGSFQVSDSEFIFESRNIISSSFLFDCWNCEFCFGATNARNKKYLWFNEQLTEDEWKKRRAQIDLSKTSVFEECRRRFYDLWREEGVWQPTSNYGNENSEGERVIDCVNSHECYWQNKSVDCFRCRYGVQNNGCFYTSGQGMEISSYMCTGGMYGKNKFCMSCARGTGLEYCSFCSECENCFGCFGLKHARFHIFNAPYSEEEYWQELDRLKCRMLDEGSYGKFFPAKFSPSGFQFSASELFVGFSNEELRLFEALVFDPTRGQILAPGKENQLSPINAAQVPDTLEETAPEKFVGVSITDGQSPRNFSVTSAEFEMYKKKRWPFPRKHFITRLVELVRHSNSPIEERVSCGACGKDVMTYKNFIFPERKVYCKECYLKFLEQNN